MDRQKLRTSESEGKGDQVGSIGSCYSRHTDFRRRRKSCHKESYSRRSRICPSPSRRARISRQDYLHRSRHKSYQRVNDNSGRDLKPLAYEDSSISESGEPFVAVSRQPWKDNSVESFSAHQHEVLNLSH